MPIRLPSSLPPWLRDWAVAVIGQSALPSGESWILSEPAVNKALQDLLEDTAVCSALARQSTRLEREYADAARYRLKRFLEFSAAGAVSNAETLPISVAHMADELQDAARRCGQLAALMRRLQKYSSGPGYSSLPRRLRTVRPDYPVAVQGKPARTWVPEPDYLESRAREFDSEAAAWKVIHRERNRARLGGKNAVRNRLADGLIEIALEELDDVPFALVTAMVVVLTGVDTDESTIRGRTRRIRR